MNERIQKLAREAFIKERKEFCADWKESELSEALLEDFQVVFENFAELIVAQCAEMVANDPRINWLDAAQIAKEMREKFAEKA